MNWQNLLEIKIVNGSLAVTFGPLLIGGALATIVIIILIKLRNKTLLPPSWKVEKANIKLGGIGDVSIKPDYEDIQIAHKAWVELSTRKAGLAFDDDHDVILEIYDSWYQMFKEMRELAKQIPADRIRSSEDTRELVTLLIDALNKGLRPHLTKWQAKYRRWYSNQTKAYPHKSPQEIQKKYPGYKELITELKAVNRQMVQYTDFLHRVAHGMN